jgi:hypothetical protein
LVSNILEISIGLAFFGFFILFLGLVKLLYAWIALGVIFLVSLLNIKLFGVLKKDISFHVKRIKEIFYVPFRIFLFGIVLLGFFLNITGVFSPPIGQDALVYHLSDAKYFAEAHQINKRPFSSNSLYPYLIEMFFTYGLVYDSEFISKSFNFIFLLLIFFITYAFSSRYVDIDKSLFISTLTLFMPAIIVLAKYAYVEVGLALFTTLNFYSLIKFIENKENKWLILTAIFSGCCMSIKAFGIFTVIFTGIIIFYEFLKARKIKVAFKSTFLFFIVSLLVGGVWYLRSWIGWGNPFYPFYIKYIGENGWYKPKLTAPVGVRPTLLNLINIFWLITMRVDTFGGGANQFGLLFLLFLPIILVTFYKNKEIRYLALSSVLFIFAWFFTYQNIRHLSPYIPVFSIITIFSYEKFTKKDNFLKRFLSLAMLMVLFLNVGLAFYYYKDEIFLFLRKITPTQYIFKHDRTGKISFYINENLPEDAKIMLVGELRDYRFNREVIRDVYYQRYTSYLEEVKSKKDAISFLIKDGFTHILYRFAPLRKKRNRQFSLIELLNDREFVKKYLILEKVIDYNYDKFHRSRYYLYRIKFTSLQD